MSPLAIIIIAIIVCILLSARADSANSVSRFSSGLNGPCDGTIFEACGDGLHCCWAQGCGAAHWTCQVNCDHNQLCGENPVGAACSSNDDCANSACGRAGAGAAPTCCASGSTDSYWSYDYCTQLPPGTPCWTDAMCGDGSAGMCSGSLGFTTGVCGSHAPWSQYCTEMYNSCATAAENSTIASDQGTQYAVGGSALGAAELGGYYAEMARCEQQVTVCQQNGGTWGPLTYTPAAPPPPPPPPPPAPAAPPPAEQPIAWGGLTDGGDPTAGPGGIPNLGAIFG